MNNNQLHKVGLALYIKTNIPVAIKKEQTFIRNGIESTFAELTTTNGIIMFDLIYKRSVDISAEKFSVALEPLISTLEPRVKTYIIRDFNINLLDHKLSPPVENFINQMISKNFLPIINHPTKVTPHSCTLIDNIFCNRVDEVESYGVITTNISDHYPVFSIVKFPTFPEDSMSINNRVFFR